MPCQIATPLLKPEVFHHNGILYTQKPAHSHFASQTQAPAARFSDFWPQPVPPLCLTESHPPATSNSMYPTPIGSTLPKNQPTCHSLAKTEPPPLGFYIFAHNNPPRASPNHILRACKRRLANTTRKMHTNEGR